MSKQTIEWHRESYGNWKGNLDRHEERTLKELEKIKQDRIKLGVYKFLIDEAGRLGKDGFDRDKFRVKKVKKE